ncbi:MAG TPA: hypothetical protein PL157_23680, partial [Acidobacteriota bacterium]|nr:hypothetical protein [Acidobacteriota bacterium]
MEHLALYSRLKPSNFQWKILVIGVVCLLGWMGGFLLNVKAQNQNGNQKGLRFRVQQLPSQPVSKPESSPKPPAIWIPESEVNRLLARLPALATQPQPFSQFRFPNRVVPLPTGMTLRPAVFDPKPSTAKPAPPDASPLTILRFAPQGEIDLATTLTVMFSQPMVPLTSLDGLSQLPVPVQLTPQPPGRWRWVSPQTLVYEPTGGKFPMATRYQVHIPGETRSQTGNQLEQSLNWEFTTPSLNVTLAQVNIPDLPFGISQEYNPNRASHKSEIFLEFNQKVNPTELIKHVYLKAQFDRFEVEPVDPSEVKLSYALKVKLQAAKPGQWVLVRPITALPNDSFVTGVVTAGLPSAEGPASLAQPFAFTFRTAYPLHVTWGNDGKIEWYPRLGAIVGFSNYLNLESVRTDLVMVDPPVGETQVSSDLNTVRVQGRFLPEVAYTIRVKPGIRDIYGQTLAESEAIQVCFHHESSSLRLSSEYVLTLDPA